MRTLLFPFSWLYGFIIWLRNICYDVGIIKSIKISVPVISVGNITAGGTGKTPHVIYIVERLLERKKKIAIISRGYKRKTKGTFIVSNGKQIFGTAQDSGDEPYLLANKFPMALIIVDEERVRAATIAVEQFAADVIVLDDGFQHRKIMRDLDIVIIDSQKEREPLLPSGNRREPYASLKRSDVIIFSRWNISRKNIVVDTIAKTYQQKILLKTAFLPEYLTECNTQTRMPVEMIHGINVLAFCGIGNPDSFQTMLNKCGAAIVEFVVFADHHAYTESDCKRLADIYEQKKPMFLITTEKDFIRLRDSVLMGYMNRLPLCTLAIGTTFIEGEEKFKKTVEKVFN